MSHEIPRYAAIVLYYNLGPAFLETLEALASTDAPPTEVIVVNNSPDDLRAEPAARAFGFGYLAMTRNLGYAGGMNAGLTALKTDAEQVLLMTHEVVLERSAPTILSSAQKLSGGLVGPVLRRAGDGSIWSRGGTIDRWGRVRHITTHHSPMSPLIWLDGACLMTTRSLMATLGGFDERFFLYWEDVDLGYRAGQRGFRVSVAEGALATQETGLVPPYWEARNHPLFWRAHRRARPLFMAIIIQGAKMLNALGRRDVRVFRERRAGLRDAIRRRPRAYPPR